MKDTARPLPVTSDLSALLWALLLAIVVIMVCILSIQKLSQSSPLPAPHMVSDVLVELQPPSGPPAVYRLPEGSKFKDLLRIVGIQAFAPELAERPCITGDSFRVFPDGSVSVGRMSGQRLITLGIPISLNHATAEDLAEIPGIGQTLAGRIVEFRNQSNGLHSYEELDSVRGVGEKTIRILEHYTSLSE